MNTETEKIKVICVVGAGTMGYGIALVCAQKGFKVMLNDITNELVEKGMQRIQTFLDGSIERGKITKEEKDLIFSKIEATSRLPEAAKDADLVIEAVVENMEVKKKLFKELDEICLPHCVLSTNTSSLSVTEIAAVTKRPEKVVGMHWGNPAPIMRGIEVVRTEKTAQEMVNLIVELSRQLGKVPSVCKDTPGFVPNRLMPPWRNECMRLYDEQVASMEDIDKAFKVAYGVPMGPFELTDLTGLDVSLNVQKTLYSELGRELFRPAQCFIMKVKAGDLGRKTGQGFYKY